MEEIQKKMDRLDDLCNRLEAVVALLERSSKKLPQTASGQLLAELKELPLIRKAYDEVLEPSRREAIEQAKSEAEIAKYGMIVELGRQLAPVIIPALTRDPKMMELIASKLAALELGAAGA